MFNFIIFCFIINFILFQATEIPLDITREISFQFYYGPTVNDYEKISYEDGLKILENKHYDTNLKTVFYHHGWSEKPSIRNNYSVDIIADAFLQTRIANLVAVNYENLVQHVSDIIPGGPPLINMGAGYLGAVKNATFIGSALGKFFRRFIESCSCRESLHLIGFSLGAHIMSFAALEYGPGLLPHLTALDAAGPLFQYPKFSGLSKQDGGFVDVIHTDGGRLGYLTSLGTVDFFPNLGSMMQPSCDPTKPIKCSHYMSVYYYAESILNPESFPARKCDNAFKWTTNFCSNQNVTSMGYYINTRVSGNYYLNTNSKSPYGRGEEGSKIF